MFFLLLHSNKLTIFERKTMFNFYYFLFLREKLFVTNQSISLFLVLVVDSSTKAYIFLYMHHGVAMIECCYTTMHHLIYQVIDPSSGVMHYGGAMIDRCVTTMHHFLEKK
uniref:Succinate--CoA ligase [ADP-forming] subunit n=1 Tax=Jaagichlorella roystonensis TaxID=1052852 RepID=A0A6C0M8T8_9CHLO|nr:Succinate--CoA ligase [ADP-forming] subunit [Jaagichlorella roystonensis]QHU78317.1 Succinate--CoA ligase [ADP-forming] subunit [Jaagichlorella roystonensis]